MSAPGWSPTTTGDRQIDAAIYRFIYNPATLPCDVRSTAFEWWVTGGHDGVPDRILAPIWKDERYKGSAPHEPGFTRTEIMKARA